MTDRLDHPILLIQAGTASGSLDKQLLLRMRKKDLSALSSAPIAASFNLLRGFRYTLPNQDKCLLKLFRIRRERKQLGCAANYRLRLLHAVSFFSSHDERSHSFVVSVSFRLYNCAKLLASPPVLRPEDRETAWEVSEEDRQINSQTTRETFSQTRRWWAK